MRKKSLKILSVILVAVMSVSSMVGCGDKKSDKEKQGDSAMGRYLESDITLPESVEPYNMALLEDGTIRVAVDKARKKAEVWDMQEDESWEKAFDIEIDLEGYTSAYVGAMALSPDGGGAFMAYMKPEGAKEDDFEDVVYYYFTPDGKTVKSAYQPGTYSYYLKYAGDGEFYCQNGEFKLIKVNFETGEETFVADDQDFINFYGVVGDKLLVGDYQMNVFEYDRKTGEPLPADEILQESVKNSGMEASPNAAAVEALPVLFCDGEEENSFFYCGSAGLFRHSQDGNVSEKVIDGTLTSMGNPDLGFKSLVRIGEEFYLLASGSNGGELFKYTYSSDVPTVPNTEISAYTLYDNVELQQAISMYQKEHPDVYVRYEVGMTGEDSMTVSDELRTLNTEIVAGDGPDFLLTDGMPVDSYIEKGLLEDVTEIVNTVDSEEGLFTNITSASEQDGKIYAVPLRFQMPVIQGSKEILDNVTDLKTLADEAERQKAENPDRFIAGLDYFTGKVLTSRLYGACSAAWIKEDGSVDEEKLAEFYTQVKRIFDCDERSEENLYDYPNDSLSYYSSIMAGLVLTYDGKNAINFANMSEPLQVASFSKTSEVSETGFYKCLQGQVENGFQPTLMAGINSKSKNKDTALDFMQFLLRKDAQTASQGSGLPVNKKATKELLGENTFKDNTIGDQEPGKQGEYILLMLNGVSDKAFEEYIQNVESLTTPALSNEIMRNAVLDQADACVKGEITPEEAVKEVTDTVNLYLAEN